LKILCVSDQIDPLVYSPSIKERYGNVEMVLSAGDLPLDYLEFIVSSLDRPLYFVFGNHNLKEFAYYTRKPAPTPYDASTYQTAEVAGAGTIFLGGKARHEGELLIMGLGGSLRYNNGENQYTDFQMWLRIIRLLPVLIFNRLVHGRYLDILLTHAPPAGLGDRSDPCHRGFRCFLAFMHFFKPRYLLHGHIHLYDLCEPRVRQFEDTTIINVFSNYVLEL
jgi:Icc-related predicted phosphoesterase